MDTSLLFEANELAIGVIFLVAMVAGAEIGFRVGRTSLIPEDTRPPVSTVEASVLGVLALLLGFTMAMAVSRFEARKQLVLQEANAIGTAHLRAQLLPSPDGAAIAELLRQYVDCRIRYVGAGVDLDRLRSARLASTRLAEQFWSRAVAYAKTNPNPVQAGLLLQALNQVIDLEAERWMAFHNHVPSAVIYTDALVAWLAVVLVGYTFGLTGQRQILSMGLLIVAITVVLAVIVDLDRPRHGFIQVSQQPMIDLQEQLRTPVP